MKHIFRKGTNPAAPTLLLLHGTGGDENDLLPLADRIYPGASVLSVRGNVLENGMPRFFRRLAEGVFDEEDLVFRTQELHDFLDQASVQYKFERENIIAVGYSNGANIAGSLLFHYPDVLKGAILYHPMVPRRGISLPDMSQLPVFIGAGSNDPICSPLETKELQQLLSDAGASVTLHWESYGHQLTVKEVDASAQWFADTFSE
ncbi:phospholipase/carboxylesterase [Brevibacillus reuszeri]|uniref:Carboxylesterase n=1 Tax=Brevibacillus reuszeri TaxID=54915 RepID=A0A0K9Z1H7_9BACL|nr:alpha/beta hydrolase [Brevibacillus reuszeri]KNB74828.1 carboxylesterase [Brevibacillus reuszeri]MED1859523.1 alpha/beta hydrolase [Brevibacillus reuszeri]GED71977.1 phospholipase/carboxylesterase [Brevibacillus reuszeri]